MLSELKERYAYEEARSIVFSLLEHYLQVSKAKIMLQFNLEIPDITLPPLARALDDLKANKPLQYILGKAWFMENEFRVNQYVLIPRPETEEMVQMALSELEQSVMDTEFPMRLLDIGTGSGCIAITIKNHFPEITVYAMDNSDEALDIARENAQNLRSEVIFYNADILVDETLEGLPSVDILISNPPYVTESDKASMQANVLNYEPGTALYVPDTEPLLYYRAIASFAAAHVRPGGLILLEINERMGNDVKNLYLEYNFAEVQIIKDLFGKDRFLKCRSN